MISGLIFDGLLPPEHPWGQLAAAGGSLMPKSAIFDGFWLSSGVPWGAIWGPWGALLGLIGALDGVFQLFFAPFNFRQVFGSKMLSELLEKWMPGHRIM